MVKNIILYIFIYVICVGCETPLTCHDCYLDISAPELEIDENGYYHLQFLNDYNQTFSTLKADTGIKQQKVKWLSNREINIQYHNTDNWTNLVNQNSYTDDDGIAYTVLGVWKNFVGDTIKVYCGYTNNCSINYVDSLEVIINE